MFVGLLLCVRAYSQGTLYTYTFTGDTSPLSVSVMFSATREAVASQFLTETNILGGYMDQGGRRAPIDILFFPVRPDTGTPLYSINGRYLQAVSFFGMDELDVEGGAQGYSADISFWPWVGSPQNYPTAGKWSVAVVPEPPCSSLLLLVLTACCYWRARSLPQRACR